MVVVTHLGSPKLTHRTFGRGVRCYYLQCLLVLWDNLSSLQERELGARGLFGAGVMGPEWLLQGL